MADTQSGRNRSQPSHSFALTKQRANVHTVGFNDTSSHSSFHTHANTHDTPTLCQCVLRPPLHQRVVFGSLTRCGMCTDPLLCRRTTRRSSEPLSPASAINKLTKQRANVHTVGFNDTSSHSSFHTHANTHDTPTLCQCVLRPPLHQRVVWGPSNMADTQSGRNRSLCHVVAHTKQRAQRRSQQTGLQRHILSPHPWASARRVRQAVR